VDSHQRLRRKVDLARNDLAEFPFDDFVYTFKPMFHNNLEM
jgi:hypothetical protein